MLLNGKHILLGVTGGIAAYKSAYLVRLLVQQGAQVRVLMTPMAQQFVAPLTFATLSQHPVLTDFYNPTNGDWHSHVALGEWADLMIIAPATANTLAKMVGGIADNLLLTTYLSMRAPVLVAPAMDREMYCHAATQMNQQKLKDAGVEIVEPGSGFLASGLEGKGRMAEPEEILTHVLSHFAARAGNLRGKKVLVTSGPTREPLDPVRFISNHSSGQMGAAIADALALRGAEVHCIAGPSIQYPKPLQQTTLYRVETAEQMHAKCLELWADMHVAIMAAAVADYRPATLQTQKIPHKEQVLHLELVSCPDIAKALGEHKQAHQYLVGFALETGNGLENAQRKLTQKRMDLCILNTLADAGAGFCTATNKTTFVYADGKVEPRPLELKTELSEAIAESVAQMLLQRS